MQRKVAIVIECRELISQRFILLFFLMSSNSSISTFFSAKFFRICTVIFSTRGTIQLEKITIISIKLNTSLIKEEINLIKGRSNQYNVKIELLTF